MSLYAPTLARQKPPRWAPVSKGLVAPEWQWAWRGLAGCWLLGEGSTIDDLLKSSVGTLQSGVTWVDSRYGPALNFAGGSNNRVNLGNQAVLQVGFPLTLFALAKADNFTNLGQLIATDDWALDGALFCGAHLGLLTSSGNKAYAEFGSAGGADLPYRNTKIGATALSTSVWYFFVATFEGNNNINIYVDGINVGGSYSGTATTIGYSASQARMGVHSSSTAGFDGQIILAGVYNRKLALREIFRLSLDPFAPFRMAEEEDYRVTAAGLSIPVAMHHRKMLGV